MEFFETPVVVVKVDEGGDGGAELGEVGIGTAVDDLFLEGAVEALDDAVGLRLAEQGEAGDEAVEAGVGLEEVVEVLAAVVVAEFDAAGGLGLAAEDTVPRAWAMGSQAAKRSPILQTCQPRHSPFQCSRRSKSQTQPSSVVQILAPSVAQRTLGAWVMMRPSWALAGVKALRWGGKQAVLAHEAQDAIAADLVAGDKVEACVDLAVAFADEG